MTQIRWFALPDLALTTAERAADGRNVKFPVTLCGAVMAMVCGVAAPLSPPANPVKRNPGLADAATAVEVPAGYHPAPLTDPPEAGDVCVVNSYSVRNLPP